MGLIKPPLGDQPWMGIPPGPRRPNDVRRAGRVPRFGWLLAGLGVCALAVATASTPSEARAAASQDWPPFALVAGLLLVGLVADDDDVFAFAGRKLAGLAGRADVMFLGACLMVGVVTALLNLDTSVAFLTPVLVYAARSRGEDEARLLYLCLLLSNVR
jgi:Na+/H+ antiporter NhaD/arsenite permease-like protein